MDTQDLDLRDTPSGVYKNRRIINGPDELNGREFLQVELSKYIDKDVVVCWAENGALLDAVYNLALGRWQDVKVRRDPEPETPPYRQPLDHNAPVTCGVNGFSLSEVTEEGFLFTAPCVSWETDKSGVPHNLNLGPEFTVRNVNRFETIREELNAAAGCELKLTECPEFMAAMRELGE